MIVVTNTIQIKSGFGEQVAERFKNPKGVHTMPGFAGMELLLDRKEESDELKVVTHWTDKASFDNWVNSDSFKQAHARRAPEGAENAAPAGGAQPMGGTAADGNPAPEHAASSVRASGRSRRASGQRRSGSRARGGDGKRAESKGSDARLQAEHPRGSVPPGRGILKKAVSSLMEETAFLLVAAVGHQPWPSGRKGSRNKPSMLPLTVIQSSA